MPRSGLETFTLTPSRSPSGAPSCPATATLTVFAPGANGRTSTPNAAMSVYSTADRPAYAGPAPSPGDAAPPASRTSPSGRVELASSATAPIRAMPTTASALRPGPIRPRTSNRPPFPRAATAAALTRWWCAAMPTIARASPIFAMMIRPYVDPATSPMSPSRVHMRTGPDTATAPIEAAASTVNLGTAASMRAPPPAAPLPRSAGSSANARYATPPIHAAATRLCR